VALDDVVEQRALRIGAGVGQLPAEVGRGSHAEPG
jgi:hypothetical protein